jgi:hypothetical protein
VSVQFKDFVNRHSLAPLRAALVQVFNRRFTVREFVRGRSLALSALMFSYHGLAGQNRTRLLRQSPQTEKLD